MFDQDSLFMTLNDLTQMVIIQPSTIQQTILKTIIICCLGPCLLLCVMATLSIILAALIIDPFDGAARQALEARCQQDIETLPPEYFTLTSMYNEHNYSILNTICFMVSEAYTITTCHGDAIKETNVRTNFALLRDKVELEEEKILQSTLRNSIAV